MTGSRTFERGEAAIEAAVEIESLPEDLAGVVAAVDATVETVDLQHLKQMVSTKLKQEILMIEKLGSPSAHAEIVEIEKDVETVEIGMAAIAEIVEIGMTGNAGQVETGMIVGIDHGPTLTLMIDAGATVAEVETDETVNEFTKLAQRPIDH